MEIRWEKLYSGGLGRFYDTSESSRRRARRAQLAWFGGVISIGVVIGAIAIAWRWI
ncbi:hypothetical protein HUS70_07150 [Pandoraea nosoerga]|uniref:Uncharacterized protein n=1 Tax=Pandoraea nosoerga TaxID=2508296 RepID=A0A5E4TJQ2_9BURK|nr:MULTISPECIES: hypothetical protein [Pandoraea]MBN4665486.1 hypothetical protein [Pandoraea nosoerga]MBN4675011.1 hypothetical protein [Pandoraea nosoerga]MBN4680327.1 hypothetical protein [Pandoraea nosoerga]MBN4744440.1 hypothetical protein [Pandoraea nosoerga]VVD87323.1 hypothetical protein PNO31109_01414 [Pandoraea nosoerga]